MGKRTIDEVLPEICFTYDNGNFNYRYLCTTQIDNVFIFHNLQNYIAANPLLNIAIEYQQ